MNYGFNLVRVFQQTEPSLQSNWDIPRKQTLFYSSFKEGKAAAEEAFYMLNAPLDLLSPYQRDIVRYHRSHSLSVGDVVKVNEEEYLCNSIGWIKK